MKKHLLGAFVLIAALTLVGCNNDQKKETNNGTEQVTTIQPVVDRLLIIVDPQIDFTTGSLAVANGPAAMDRLAETLRDGMAEKFDRIIVTQDYHPANHCSFVEQGGVFPPHCVQGTEGYKLYPALQEAIDSCVKKDVIYLTKGDLADKEEFSVFQNEKNGAKLTEIIKSTNFEGIDICGIASDYCVLETLKDLLKFYPAEKVRVAMNCVAAVSDEEVLPAFMKENNIDAISF